MNPADLTPAILIIEDEEGLALLIQKRLREAGLSSHAVHSGAQAIEFFQTHEFPSLFLLIDFQLGDMTAEALLHRLRDVNPHFSFLIMTGQGTQQIAVTMMKLGAYDYILKDNQFLDLLASVVFKCMEKHKTQEMLRLTQKALDVAYRALHKSPIGIAVAERKEGRHPILYANPAFEEITRYASQNGTDLQQWLNQYPDAESFQLNAFEPSDSFPEKQVVLKIQKPNGAVQWQQISLSGICESDRRISHIIAIVSDITQLRESEQKLLQLLDRLDSAQRLAIRGRAASEMAHEIGNPLTLISSRIQHMISRNSCKPEELKILLEHIDRICVLMKNHSNIADQKTSHRCAERMEAILETVLELLNLKSDLREIQISKQVQPNLPSVYADKHQITQVVLNLLLNAIEACGQQGRIEIRIFSHPSGQSDPAAAVSHVGMSIRDSGAGIDESHLPKIFDPFYSTKVNDKSRGLGLSICKSILQAHDGWVEAQTSPGRGTCFIFYLPAGSPHAIRKIADLKESGQKSPPATRLRKGENHGHDPGNR